MIHQDRGETQTERPEEEFPAGDTVVDLDMPPGKYLLAGVRQIRRAVQ
jgi:hypothetical protein